MDQFSAHLDRGWDLVQRGDAIGAESSGRRALELDSESPEAYNLLGFAAAMAGEYEEAVEHYREAIALDDTYLEAILNTAELCIHPLGEFEEAERLCDDALELVEEDEERIDALLLKFDALLGQEKTAEAKALCERFPNGPFTNPAHAFLTGRALFEVSQTDRAALLLEEAVRSTPDNAEAQYYLGLLRDEQGRTQEAVEAFVATRELDLAAAPTPASLSATAFKGSVTAAVAALPDELKALIREREVYVDALPGLEVVVDGVDPRTLLLLDSVEPPRVLGTEPDADAQSQLRLFVYQRNVERVIGSVEQLVPELTLALTQELNGHLEQLRELAQGALADD